MMARPAEFDRDEVLERATQAFWDQGYCATSMATLTEATKLKPGSLYAAFKSKEGLFLATLDHYGTLNTEGIRQVLSSAATPMEGIRAFLHQMVSDSEGPAAKRSCFLVNTVLEVARSNDQVRDRVNLHLDNVENLVRETLESAQEQGELGADQDPVQLAAFIMTNLWGMRVRLAAEADRQKTQAVIDQLLKLLQ